MITLPTLLRVIAHVLFLYSTREGVWPTAAAEVFEPRFAEGHRAVAPPEGTDWRSVNMMTLSKTHFCAALENERWPGIKCRYKSQGDVFSLGGQLGFGIVLNITNDGRHFSVYRNCPVRSGLHASNYRIPEGDCGPRHLVPPAVSKELSMFWKRELNPDKASPYFFDKVPEMKMESIRGRLIARMGFGPDVYDLIHTDEGEGNHHIGDGDNHDERDRKMPRMHEMMDMTSTAAFIRAETYKSATYSIIDTTVAQRLTREAIKALGRNPKTLPPWLSSSATPKRNRTRSIEKVSGGDGDAKDEVFVDGAPGEDDAIPGEKDKLEELARNVRVIAKRYVLLRTVSKRAQLAYLLTMAIFRMNHLTRGIYHCDAHTENTMIRKLDLDLAKQEDRELFVDGFRRSALFPLGQASQAGPVGAEGAADGLRYLLEHYALDPVNLSSLLHGPPKQGGMKDAGAGVMRYPLEVVVVRPRNFVMIDPGYVYFAEQEIQQGENPAAIISPCVVRRPLRNEDIGMHIMQMITALGRRTDKSSESIFLDEDFRKALRKIDKQLQASKLTKARSLSVFDSFLDIESDLWAVDTIGRGPQIVGLGQEFEWFRECFSLHPKAFQPQTISWNFEANVHRFRRSIRRDHLATTKCNHPAILKTAYFMLRFLGYSLDRLHRTAPWKTLEKHYAFIRWNFKPSDVYKGRAEKSAQISFAEIDRLFDADGGFDDEMALEATLIP